MRIHLHESNVNVSHYLYTLSLRKKMGLFRVKMMITKEIVFIHRYTTQNTHCMYQCSFVFKEQKPTDTSIYRKEFRDFIQFPTFSSPFISFFVCCTLRLLEYDKINSNIENQYNNTHNYICAFYYLQNLLEFYCYTCYLFLYTCKMLKKSLLS